MLSISESQPRLRLLILECVEVLLAGIFFLVGGAKLVGTPDMVALFRDVGLGQWFRYVTGGIEVVGATLLVIPFFAGVSAIMLGTVMVAATLIELFVLHRPPVAALACLSAHTFVAWARMSNLVRTAPLRRGTPMSWSATVRKRWRFAPVVKRSSSAARRRIQLAVLNVSPSRSNSVRQCRSACTGSCTGVSDGTQPCRAG
jgi:uncharacterized membrane protein YphA (DoxX/SURF4 family)